MALRSHADVPIRAYRRYFSLTSIDEVVNLLRDVFLTCGANPSAELDSIKGLHHLCLDSLDYSKKNNSNATKIHTDEPNLAFISIILGYIEHQLTMATTSESNPMKPKTTPLSRKALLNNQPTLSFTPSRSRSSSFNKSFHSPLSVHIEAPEEDFDDENRLTPVNPPSELSPTLSITETVCSGSTNSGQLDQNIPHRRRRVSRRCRTNDRVRHRRLSTSSVNTTTTEVLEDPLTPPQNQPLQVITDNEPSSSKRRRFSDSTVPKPSFPCLTFEEAERLYHDFHTIITTSPKLKPYALNTAETTSTSRSSTPVTRYATRCLISAVCEVLWSRMNANRGRERLIHTQSVYSFLSNNILDSFGLAYTTVAACQILGYQDVDLALSEDHGWVEFGPPEARQTADVASWIQESHSTASQTPTPIIDASVNQSVPTSDNITLPGPEDNGNPPPIRIPPLKHSWLYVNGFSVVCRPRILAVVAAVASIQPGASFSALNQAPASAPLAYVPESPQLSLSSSDLLTSTDSMRHLSPSSVISKQLVTLKTRLLWLCYDAGLLNRYPLGLTNLGDLEDAFPTMERLATFLNTQPQLVQQTPMDSNSTDPNFGTHIAAMQSLESEDQLRPAFFTDSDTSPKTRISETAYLALALYRKAVVVDRLFYANQHVYPYTCLAGCLYRHGDHRGALRFWAEAARVIGHYNHTTEDWEVYRELLDIATHLMPQMFRSATEDYRSCSEGLVDSDPDGCLYQPTNILDDPRCLAYLLIFYDHLCLWEEGSPVPVLHVGWVDKLMLNLARFSERARKYLRLTAASQQQEDNKSTQPETGDELGTKSIDTSGISRRTAGRTRSNSGTASVRSSVSCTKEANLARVNQEVPTCSPVSAVVKAELTTIKSDVEGMDSPNTQIDSSVAEVPTKVSNPPTRRKSTKSRKSSQTADQQAEILDPGLTTNLVMKPPLPEVVAALADLNPDPKPETLVDMEDQDGSPSPPLIDFPNHEDLLASLAEACDHRLLNPAFLWGVEPNAPFLPPNTAPETLDRLMTSLDAKEFVGLDQHACQQTVHHLRHDFFPTPPNSGSLSMEPSTTTNDLNASTLKNQAKCDSLSNLLVVDEHISATIPPTSHADEVTTKLVPEPPSTFFPQPFDTVDGFLDDMQDDLIDSVVDFGELKTDEVNGSTTSCPNEFLDFMLEVESRSNCKQDPHPDITTHPPPKPKDPTVHLTVYSVKMCSIVELLRARRLDSSAIKLALTAQSQVCLRRSGLTPSHFP